MARFDSRGCAVTGATPAALEACERALAALLAWRSGAETPLAWALQDAPGFVMAHLLQAYMLVCGRDPERVRAARPVLTRAAALPANGREQLHMAAIAAALADDYESAQACLAEVLRAEPRDVLARHVAHSFDYLTGDTTGMRQRVAAALPAWSRDLPGYHAMLSMQAFSLGECGEWERAEQVAAAALALNPLDARAHHAMAHVFEMSRRSQAGIRWMTERVEHWSHGTTVATHSWWHLALFHLDQGRPADALALYDRQIRAERSGAVADLIDAAALLSRIELGDGDTGARWSELAAGWAPDIDDAFCSFSDLHAMLAFVGAGDWDSARRLESALVASQSLPTRHGKTTRWLGLNACRAVMAFGRGDHGLAITLLASLGAPAHRLGGSHAQRDVLDLTMQAAVARVRRPGRRSAPRAPAPSRSERPSRPAVVPAARSEPRGDRSAVAGA